MQKVQVLLFDDIDGTEAEETILFGLDGQDYEMDLSKPNAAGLRQSIAKFVEHGRRLAPPHARRGRRSSSAGSNLSRGSDTAEMRGWLIANGYGDELKDRGRIPERLQDRFAMREPKAVMPARAEVEAAPSVEATAETPSPEAEAAVTSVIDDAKEEVRRRRQRNTPPKPEAIFAEPSAAVATIAPPAAATTTRKRQAPKTTTAKTTTTAKRGGRKANDG